MEEVKEILKSAVNNGQAIEDSIKGSFNALAVNKDANFIIIQQAESGEIIYLKSGATGGTDQDQESEREYLKAFLPGVDMILMLNNIKGEEEDDFFRMVKDVLKESFNKSDYHTINYSRLHKQFYGTSGKEWEPLKISEFIALESFINNLENLI